MSDQRSTAVSRQGSRVTGWRMRALAAHALHPVRLELVGVLVLTTLAAAVVFGAHVLHGSFYNDDWGQVATSVTGPEHSFLQRIAEYRRIVEWGGMAFRPLAIAYWPTTYMVFGESPAGHLAWTAMTAVLASVALFAVLRELGVTFRHALAIVLLVLVVPAADATRLWASTSVTCSSIALWLAGVAFALRALRASAGRSVALGACAGGCYLASVALYEITTMAIAATGVFLLARRWRSGWPHAVTAWAIAVASVAWYQSHQIYKPLSLHEQWDRLPTFSGEALRVFADTAAPFARVPGGVALGLVAGVTAVSLGRLLLRGGTAARAQLRQWGLVAVVGVVVTLAGWVVFLPSREFTPLSPGELNRVNGLAVVGIVLILYSVAALAGAALGATRRRAAFGAAAVAGVVSAALAVGYVGRLEDDIADWDRAASEQRQVLAAIHAAVGQQLDTGDVVLTFGHPITVRAGIPVFAAPWDLDGALKRDFRPDVTGFAMLPGTTLECAASEVVVHNANEGYGREAGQYGNVWLVDVASSRAIRVTSASECAAAAPEFKPGLQQLEPEPVL